MLRMYIIIKNNNPLYIRTDKDGAGDDFFCLIEKPENLYWDRIAAFESESDAQEFISQLEAQDPALNIVKAVFVWYLAAPAIEN
jgi:hypothetical protein